MNTARRNGTLDFLWAAIAAGDEAIVEAEREARSPVGDMASDIAQEALVAAKIARRSAIVAYLKASGESVSDSATERDLVAAAIRLEVSRRGRRVAS